MWKITHNCKLYNENLEHDICSMYIFVLQASFEKNSRDQFIHLLGYDKRVLGEKVGVCICTQYKNLVTRQNSLTECQYVWNHYYVSIVCHKHYFDQAPTVSKISKPSSYPTQTKIVEYISLTKFKPVIATVMLFLLLSCISFESTQQISHEMAVVGFIKNAGISMDSLYEYKNCYYPIK